MTLKDLEIGRAARIIAVHGQGVLRDRLLDMGLTPRTKVTIRKAAPMGDPIEISLRCYELTLRKADAANIEVECEEALPVCCRERAGSLRMGRRFGRRGRRQQ